MGKKIKHMGMDIAEEEHRRWHEEHQEMTSEQHEALMERMRVSEEEDKEWHRTHGMSEETEVKKGQRPVNPFAIGGAFLDYCVKQGWLTKEGEGRKAKYYVTKEGKEELEKFGIRI